jgi:hypothetical protein
MLAVLALVAFLMAWAFALFGAPHAAFFHPPALAYLGLALLAAHLVFGLGVPWRKGGA